MPWSRAIRLIEMLRSGAHQAPLRPLAPNPAISRSRITIRNDGSRRRQVERGPQAGQPGAEDRDVGVGRAVERRTRGQVVPGVPQPERDRAVVHGGDGSGAGVGGVRPGRRGGGCPGRRDGAREYGGAHHLPARGTSDAADARHPGELFPLARPELTIRPVDDEEDAWACTLTRPDGATYEIDSVTFFDVDPDGNDEWAVEPTPSRVLSVLAGGDVEGDEDGVDAQGRVRGGGAGVSGRRGVHPAPGAGRRRSRVTGGPRARRGRRRRT